MQKKTVARSFLFRFLVWEKICFCFFYRPFSSDHLLLLSFVVFCFDEFAELVGVFSAGSAYVSAGTLIYLTYDRMSVRMSVVIGNR